MSADALVCVGVGLVLTGISFGASGGTQLARTTYTEMAVMIGGALLAGAALVVPRPAARVRGAWSLVGLAALAVLTAASITWSLSPSDSWVEANRMLSYVAAFAGALGLVRLAPGRWAGMVGGVALASVVVVVWALLTKVFPATLSPDDTFARLRAPYGYWNAVGLSAALGVPAADVAGGQALGQPGAQRAGLPGARALLRGAAALLLARRPAGRRRSGSPSGSRSSRCGCEGPPPSSSPR